MENAAFMLIFSFFSGSPALEIKQNGLKIHFDFWGDKLGRRKV
jgi:hypothetical protein